MRLLILCSLILLENFAYAEPYQSADARVGRILVGGGIV